MASPATATPSAPSTPSPGQGAGAPSSAPKPGDGSSSGAERDTFDAHADAAELFEGPDSAAQEEGQRLAAEALDGIDQEPDAPEAEQPESDEQQGEDGPFEFAGFQWENRAQLEQYIAGQTQAAQALQARVAAIEQAGIQWRDHALQLEAALQGDGQGEDGQQPAAQPGAASTLPQDFVEAYHQTFGPEWLSTAQASFMEAINASDEAGVQRGFQGLMSSLLAQVARFVHAREGNLAQRIEPIEGRFREAHETDRTVRTLGALTSQMAGLRDASGPVFSDLFQAGPDGRPVATDLGRQMLPQITKLMVKNGWNDHEGFAYAYLIAKGLRDQTAPQQPTMPTRPSGDPTLSGAGAAPVGVPRRQAPPRDPTGLPDDPPRRRTMGIPYGR